MRWAGLEDGGRYLDVVYGRYEKNDETNGVDCGKENDRLV